MLRRAFPQPVPKRIRPFFLWERKLQGTLARCAAETIRTFYRHALEQPSDTPGIVTSILVDIRQTRTRTIMI